MGRRQSACTTKDLPRNGLQGTSMRGRCSSEHPGIEGKTGKLAVKSDTASSVGSNAASAAMSSKLCGSFDGLPIVKRLFECGLRMQMVKDGQRQTDGWVGLKFIGLGARLQRQFRTWASEYKRCRVDHVPAGQRVSHRPGKERAWKSISLLQCSCRTSDYPRICPT